MNRLPDIGMPEEISNTEIKSINNLEEDLKIIGEGEVLGEDLKSDPFIRPGPFIKAVPIVPDKVKPKKGASDKQKAHLAAARKIAREKKAEKLKEKESAKHTAKIAITPDTVQPILEPKEPILDTAPPILEPKEDEYMRWLDKMDKYKRMTALLEKQEQEKAALILKKETELENKYFKKFKQQQQRLRLQQAEEQINTKRQNPPELPTILEQKEPFGQFSHYF